MTIRFDGQVAIVTGAGRGIGRATAIGLAKRGAQVVVNDYGGGPDAVTAGQLDVSQGVVDEIIAAGGRAIADGSSVGTAASADAIATRALEAFGRIDILINNAGGNIVTDLGGETDEELSAVIGSNFMGGYRLIRRVWPIMQAQRYGRIVNMMSAAILGMEKTSTYSTGKSGMIGLTNVAATEGAPYGILVNGIWPVGHTRLVGGLTDPALIAWMNQFPPHLVAEAIIYFSSSENAVTGEMFSVGAGRVARNAFYNAEGFRDASLTAESLAANIEEARDMSKAVLLAKTSDNNDRFFPISPV
jgi:NAD(P)-dependent dehydrogenase (short-subunit alcohol dehydrogenase family)